MADETGKKKRWIATGEWKHYSKAGKLQKIETYENGEIIRVEKVKEEKLPTYSGNGKLSIDECVGHNLENGDKLKTAGGSVGVSTSGVTSIRKIQKRIDK